MAVCKRCGSEFRGVRGQVYCSLNCAIWSRVDVRGKDECWPWTGAIGTHGYGVFDFAGEHYTSHTAVLLVLTGITTRRSKGDRVVAMHSCDNRPCCNPDHVSAGSQKKNLSDARERGRLVSIGPRGERARTAVLTEHDVREIRSSNASSAELALKYGVSTSHIWGIRVRRAWKHI